MTETIDQKSGGNYEILRNRLKNQGEKLASLTQKFNEKRLNLFGKSKNEIIGKVNVYTENRCTPVDIAQVNDLVLMGYHVVLGLKQVPVVEDVLLLYRLIEEKGQFRIETVPHEGSFLDNPEFKRSFVELFTYYKDARLVKVRRDERWLYIAFQIGQLLSDLKVFRFEIRGNNAVHYIDDQGHHDIYDAKQSDIEWKQTTREDHITGKHPHVNILDTLFVETVGGDLTIKIENNTETGLGIYQEEVLDKHQLLADAEISYATVSEFILLRILPHREKEYRYILFNKLTEKVIRLDAIGTSCKLLPEDHGLIFSQGYALASGEIKLFDEHTSAMRYSHTIFSPNGEDVLYVFYDPTYGAYLLYSYSLIAKDVASPIYNHGFCRFNDGRLLMFRHMKNDEVSRVHALRVWQTPYVSLENYETSTKKNIPLFYRNNGNADLVRGISDLNTIVQYTSSKEVTQSLFEALISYSTRVLDQYYWLQDAEVTGVSDQINEIIKTASDIIDEFVKVQEMQATGAKRLEAHAKQQQALITKIKVTTSESATTLIEHLSELKSQQGALMALKNERYIDYERLDRLNKELGIIQIELNQRLVKLLQDEGAYAPYFERIDSILDAMADANRSVDLVELNESVTQIRNDLMLVNDEVASIETEDPTQSTTIIDFTTNVISRLNAVSAQLKNKEKSIRSVEVDAEFASQFKLLTQSIESSLAQIDTPEDVDLQQARVMSMIEKLESRFAEFDQFLAEIYAKRNEVITIFENRKKDQLSQYQRRIDNITSAAKISLKSIQNRIIRFDTVEALNRYFISDPLVLKVRELAQSIRALKDNIRADVLEAELKGLQDQSLRALRDNQDIFEENGAVIKLGNYRFSVNQQSFDLTLSQYQGKTAFHLTGTEFYEPVEDQAFLELERYSALDVSSESDEIYRSEYLAYSLIESAMNHETPDDVIGMLSIERLVKALAENQLGDLVAKYSAPKYREGYVKGVHDHDTVKILEAVLPIYHEAGVLRISQKARMFTLLMLSGLDEETLNQYRDDATDALLLYQTFLVKHRLEHEQNAWFHRIMNWKMLDETLARQMAEYSVMILGSRDGILVSRDAQELASEYSSYRNTLGIHENGLDPLVRYERHLTWLEAYCKKHDHSIRFIEEAAGLIVLGASNHFKLEPSQFSLYYRVEGLLGQHPRIENGLLEGSLDDLLLRGLHHQTVVYPNYMRYLETRNDLIETYKKRLNLHEFKARPLTSFVRNKLISESYLHLFGANFAKQMGTLGDEKRTDLMGLLLLISPPGYGKTTLVEYIASKMGLVFVRVNCPSLGYGVTSLDPSKAPNATAAREIEKLNFGLEMGSNVMLYLDDIQHTHPEFLQKFISLSDGTRRIDGVWQGKPKTYDMRGKKFAIVMAGNPYTESGESFKVPDMLANRADIYNLGDILSDQQESFELSYIENALTSNRVLAPLATRNLNDLYLFVDAARGASINHNDLEYPYSTLEMNEIVGILEKLLMVQTVLLKVNQQYIISAAMDNRYRTEPPFLLQGSYRDMNKLAEKVVSAMTEDELNTLINDHYIGEAQTLTTGAEENLLKLKELRGIMTNNDKARWSEIKKRFSRNVEIGSNDNPQLQIANQLAGMSSGFREIKEVMNINLLENRTFQEKQLATILASMKVIRGKKSECESLGDSIERYIDNLRDEIYAISAEADLPGTKNRHNQDQRTERKRK